MRKFVVLILILAVAFLFLVPEPMLGEYKGLLRAKYFLRDLGISAKNIATSLIKGERPKEFDTLEEKARQKAKDAAKDATIEAIKGL